MLLLLMQVIMSVMFFHGTVKEDFDARWKSRHLVKQFMEHKVTVCAFSCSVYFWFRFQFLHTLHPCYNAVIGHHSPYVVITRTALY